MRASGAPWTHSKIGRCSRKWSSEARCLGHASARMSRRSDVMRALRLATAGDRLSILCVGAHSDDVEIGVGATLLSMIARGVCLDVHWCVLSGVGDREREAQASAADFLAQAASAKIEIMAFRDGFFPEQGEDIKSWFEELKARANPDLGRRPGPTESLHTDLC